MNKADLNARLLQAVKNSLRKKYHGDDEDVNALPEPNVMLADFNRRVPRLADFLQGDSYSPADPNANAFRSAVALRLPWLRDLEDAGHSLNPGEVVVRYEKELLQPQTGNKCREDPVEGIRREHLQGETAHVLETTRANRWEKLSWRSLLAKLELEEQLIGLEHNPDFKALYAMLELVGAGKGAEVESLMVPLIGKGSIKSGHYWMMVVLSRLPQLRRLCLYQPKGSGSQLGLEGLKYLVKGLNNYKEKGGCLKELVLSRVNLSSGGVFDEKFGHALRAVGGELRVLVVNDLNMTKGMASAIAKMLSENKHLVELDLSRSNLVVASVKDVADGLMRAKTLEVVKLAGNPSMDYGVNYILYNLAFSPRVALIDISDTVVNSRSDETAEALYKLLKITGSLETLALNNTKIMNSLTYDFWRALGENVTLRHLLMDSSYPGFS